MTNFVKYFKLPAITITSIILASCGGGDDGDDPITNSAPAFPSSSAAVNFAENSTDVVYTASATDAEGNTITYALSGGDDQDQFSIGTSSGALQFKSPPDHENPSDDGGNNVYEVEISASDNSASSKMTLEVTVTNVVEDGDQSYVNMFIDDFTDALSTQWRSYGSPSPQIVDSFAGKDYVFDNNGDSNYDSGVVSINTFSLAGEEIEISADIYVDFDDLSGCWNGAELGLTSESNPDVSSTGFDGSHALRWRLHAEGDACWATPSDKRRQAWFNLGVLNEDGEWVGINYASDNAISGDPYVNSWQNARIVISKDGIVDFLIDSKLLWTSTEAIGAQYLNGKNLFLGHRSSGSAGKSYHDNILIEKNSSQQEEEQAVPATPYAPTASADSSSSIAISWSSVDNTTYYQLYQNTSNSSSSAEKIYEGSSTAGIEYDLNANTTYYYWLKACNDVGCSSFSPPTSATTEEEGDDHGDAQSAATVISLNSSVSGVIDTGDDVDYFEVVLTQSGDLTIYTEGSLDTKGWLEDSSGSILASNDDGGLSTNFSISSSLDSSTYYIRVESYGSRTGEYTLYVQFEAEQNDVFNPLPENFSATAADGEVTLSWTHYPNAIYNIYRSDNPGCDLININSCSDSLGQSELLDDKSSPFTDQGLTNGTRYYYWIEVILDGTTYLDDNSISATPTAEGDGIDINEDDYQTIYTHTDGTIYAVTKETMNWDDARAMAQEQGGDLATIHTEAENELIAELLNGETGWLGGSDDGNRIIGAFETVASSSEDGWRWIDSSEFVYENWHGTNEPNDSGTEDCLQMNYSSHTEGSWNDQSCANDFYAVFEFLGVHNFNGATALLVNDSSSPDIVSEEFITIMQEAGEVTLVDPEDITTGNIDINGFAHIGCFIYGGSSSVSNIDSETGEIISSWLNLGGTLVVNPEACGGKLLDLMDLATFGSRSNWYPALDDSKFFTEVPSDHPYFQDITPFTGEPSDYSVDYWDSGEHDSMIFRVDNSQSYTGRYGVDDYLVDPDRYLAKCFGTGWEVGSEHDCYREWDIGSGSIVMAKDLLWTFDQAEKTGGYIGIAGRKFLQNMVSVNISSAWKSHGGGSLNHKSSGRAYARQSVDNFEIIWQKTLGGSAVYPVAGDTDGDGVNDLIALADDIVYTIDRGGYSTQFNIQHGNSRYLLLSDTDGDNTSEIFVGGSENDNDTLTVGIYSGNGTLINNLVRISGYDSSVQPVSYINENRLIVRYDSGYSRDPRGVGLWNLASDEEEFYFDIGPAAVTHSDGGLSILDVNGDGLLEIAINVFTPHNGASGNGFNGNGSNTSDGDLYTILINEEGEELLSQKIGEDTSGGANGRAEHKFADIDNDGNYEIIATVAHEASYYTGDAQIRILELDGTERDRVSVGNNAYQIGMIITDINNDGYSELVIRDEAEDTIEIYDYELELVKKISVDGSSDDRIWTHSASDINGDGIQEILVSVDDVLYVYSGMDLQLLDQFTLSTHIIYAFATDLNNDDLAEIVVGTNSGELYLLGTPEDGDNDSTTPATPSAPTATANGSSSVTIGWSSVNEATYYQLYQNTSNSSSSATKIYDDSGTTTTQENLSASTTYYYWLKACNDAGCSDFSQSANVSTDEEGDDHDDSSSGATVISLNSSVSGVVDTGDDVDYFEIVLAQSGDLTVYTEGSLDTRGWLEDSSGSTLASNDDAGSGNNFNLSSSLDAGTYYIRVESYSSRTGEYTLYTEFEEEQTAPATPSAPTAIANSSSSVDISWSSVEDATYYQLYQSTSNSSSSGTKVYDDDGTSTTQDNLSANTTYYYWLKACNDAGCSDFSQVSTVVTEEEEQTAPSTPPSPTATANSSSSVYISWSSVSEATYYQLYQNTSNSSSSATEIYEGSSTNTTESGLTGNTTYYYWLKTCNDAGCSDFSQVSTVITEEEEQTAPSTPPSPTATANSSSSVYISWSSVEDATYYQLYQSTSNSSLSTTKVYDDDGTSTTQENLNSNTTYYYWLKACNNAGCSDFSQVSSVVTEEEEQTAPAAPSSPTATATSSSSVYISWSSVTKATYYQLYQSTSDSSSSATRIYENSEISTIQENLSADTTYYYWLKACNDAGCSEFSQVTSATTEEEEQTAPATPSSPTATANSSSSIEISWSSVEDATYYQLYQSTSNSSLSTTKVYDDDGTSTTQENLNSNTTYYYWLKACNDAGCSDFSEPAYATTEEERSATNYSSAWKSHGGGDLNHKSSDYAYASQNISNFEILWQETLGSSTVYPVAGDTDGDGVNNLIALADGKVHTIDRSGHNTQFNVQHGGSRYLLLSDIDDDDAYEIFVGSYEDGDYTVTTGIYSGNGTLLRNLVRSSGYDSHIQPISYIGASKLIVRYSSGYSLDPRGIGLWDIDSQEEVFYFDVGPAVGTHSDGVLSVLDVNNDGLSEITMNTFTPHNGASGNGFNGNGSNTSDGDLYTILINEEGEELLSQKIGEDTSGGANGRAEHKFADIDKDGNYEIIATVAHEASYYTGDAQIRILELDGTERGRVSVGNNAYQIGMIITDINSDGYSELVVRDEAEDTIEIYDYKLELVKKVSVNGSSDDRIWTHSASDINGDGIQEILVSIEDVLYIYSGMDLQLLDQFILSTHIIYAFATDLNNDDLAEIVVGTNSGDLYLLGVPEDGDGDSNAPDIPSAPSATASGSSSVTVSWVSVSEATYYQLYQNTSNNSSSATKIYDDSGTTATQENLSASTTYYYWLKACNDAGCSDFSQSANVSTDEEGDDHDDSSSGATVISLNSSISGVIDAGDDVDYFEVILTQSGDLTIYTEGSLDTRGWLEDSSGSTLASNDDGGSSYNFSISSSLDSGIYYIRIESYSSDTGEYTLHIEFEEDQTTPATPLAPTAIANSSSSIEISWVSVSEATYYQLYQNTSNSSSSATEIYEGSSTNTTKNGLTGNTTYYYWFKACNDAGCSGFSSSATALTIPNIATSLSADPESNGDVDLSWNSPSSGGAANYKVYARENSSNFSSSYLVYENVSSTSIEVDDDELSTNDLYYFAVQACNASGCSDYSSSANTYTAPDEVDSPSVSNITDSSADISWDEPNDNSSPNLTYSFYYDDDSSTSGAQDGTTSSTSTTISDLDSDEEYWVWIKSCNEDVCSSYSNSTTFTTLVEDDHGDDRSNATNLGVNSSVAGNIELGDDVDYFEVILTQSGDLKIYTEGSLDTKGWLEDSSGSTLDSNDDAGSSYNFSMLSSLDTGTYYVRVESYSSDTGEYTVHTEFEEGQTAPATPSAPTANANSSSSVTISWSSTDEATYYQLYQNTSNSSSSATEIYEGSSTNTTKNGLTGNTTYYYWIKACNDAGCSGFSSSATALTIPNIATSLSADPESDGDVDLSWNSPSSGGAANYKVYARENSSNFSSSYLVYENVSSTSIEVDGDELSVNDLYHFAVQACNASGCSDYSSSANTYTAPDEVDSPSVSNITDSSADISWDEPNDNSSPNLTYSFYYDDDSSTSGAQDGTTSSTSTTISDLDSDEEYWVWIKSCNEDVCSSYSNSTTFTTLVEDDHGDDRSNATNLGVNSSVAGNIELGDDVDYFEVILTQSGDLKIYTEGSLDTKGWLENSSGSTLDSNDDAGSSYNFSMLSSLDTGTYYVRVESYSSDTGEYTVHTEFEEEQTAPATPSAPTANANSSSSVTISWSSTDEATYYQLYQNTSNSSSSATEIYEGSSTNTTKNGLTGNTTYYYWIKACNDAGCSGFSSSATALTIPNIATSLSADPESDGDVDLSWNSPSSGGAANYKVYARENSSNFSSSYLVYENVSSTSIEVDDDELSANDLYYFAVQACNASGCSDYSSSANTYTAPDEVDSPNVSSITDSSAYIYWDEPNDNSSPNLTYSFYYDDDSSTSGAQNGKTTSTSATISSLDSDEKYWVWIKSCNEDICSTYSDSVTFTTSVSLPGTCSAPTVSEPTEISLLVNFTSSTCPNSDEYIVYWDDDSNVNGAYSVTVASTINLGVEIATLDPNEQYWFWLKGKNDAGTSEDYSNSETKYTLPSEITNLHFDNTESTSVRVDWSSGNGGAEYYKVYRDGSHIGNSNSTYYEDDDLSPNTSYWYRVLACNPENACSSYDTEMMVTTDGDSTYEPSLWIKVLSFDDPDEDTPYEVYVSFWDGGSKMCESEVKSNVYIDGSAYMEFDESCSLEYGTTYDVHAYEYDSSSSNDFIDIGELNLPAGDGWTVWDTGDSSTDQADGKAVWFQLEAQ